MPKDHFYNKCKILNKKWESLFNKIKNWKDKLERFNKKE